MSSEVSYTQFSDVIRSRRFNIGNHCIFYDSEFMNLFKAFKDLSDIFESIKKRIERKDVEELSSSKFAYFNYQRDKHLAPDVLYNFSHGQDFCKVVRVRKQYFVFCSWLKISDSRIYRRTPNICGAYEKLEAAIRVYDDLVYEYFRRFFDVLF